MFFMKNTKKTNLKRKICLIISLTVILFCFSINFVSETKFDICDNVITMLKKNMTKIVNSLLNISHVVVLFAPNDFNGSVYFV